MGRPLKPTDVVISKAYPKPGPMGGTLIRRLIGLLKEHSVTLPLGSHILIACSGGADSVALAHLLIQYGRRVGAKGQFELLHINHGWRGKDSDQDERFVKALGKKWGVPVTVHRLKKPVEKSGDSLEEMTRRARKEIYEKEAQQKKAIVLTAHQADDVAETMLWRLLTGAAKTHGGGISLQSGVEVRPFLNTRKSELVLYLKEEKQRWREDETNFQGRFLRSKMRLELLPTLERLFPRAIEHLVNLALEAQKTVQGGGGEAPLGALFEAAGLKMRRSNWEGVLKLQYDRSSQSRPKGIDLPSGWKLTRASSLRWILEKS